MKSRMVALACAFAALMLLCMLTTAGWALAEARTYTYGGSEADTLYEIAVASDGRIVMVGYASSSDGTLAARTKTGRSGWALCVNAQGEVLWSFCRRLGSHDTFRAPVFHEDGSVSLLLDAETNQRQTKELIRLSESGEVLLAKTLLETGGDVEYIALERTTDEGYVIEIKDAQRQSTYALYGWDGELLRQVPQEIVFAQSERHRVVKEDGVGWLYAVDGQGNRKRLVRAMEIREDGRILSRYDSLVSLEDGGAAGCGWITDGDRDKGLLTRWDVQGNLVFSWWMTSEILNDLVRTPNGFVATAYPVDTEENRFASGLDWKLIFFDEDGMRTGELPLGQVVRVGRYEVEAVMLPDGSLAVLSNVANEGNGPNDIDARLTIVPKEEIQ